MLKKLRFEFEIDPKDLALLLVHAGKMNITSAETPRVMRSAAVPALEASRGEKSAQVLVYAKDHARFTPSEVSKHCGWQGKTAYNVCYALLAAKKLKRVAKGTFSLVEALRD